MHLSLFLYKGDFKMSNEELVQLYQEGNKSALDELVENNRKIVYKLANKFYVEGTNSIDIADLQQEGFIGLMAAAKKYKFNIEKPCKFSTYAVYWIYQKMNRYIHQKSTNEEISIYTPQNDGNTELIDCIKDENNFYENVEDKIYNMQLREEIENAMRENNTLTETEVLKLRYGWDNNKCTTLVETGEVFNVSYENVRNTENRALRKLRNSTWGRKKAQEYYKETFSNSRYSITDKIKAMDFESKYLHHDFLADGRAITNG